MCNACNLLLAYHKGSEMTAMALQQKRESTKCTRLRCAGGRPRKPWHDGGVCPNTSTESCTHVCPGHRTYAATRTVFRRQCLGSAKKPPAGDQMAVRKDRQHRVNGIVAARAGSSADNQQSRKCSAAKQSPWWPAPSPRGGVLRSPLGTWRSPPAPPILLDGSKRTQKAGAANAVHTAMPGASRGGWA